MALPVGMSACAMCVEYSTATSGAATWIDASDELGVVEPPTQTRPTGEAYVFGEDLAVTGVGKREPVEVPIRGIYQEGTTTAFVFYQIFDAFTAACGDPFAVRWAPGGCTTAHEVFSTATDAEVISLTFPAGDAGSADIIMYEAIVRSNTITRATYS